MDTFGTDMAPHSCAESNEPGVGSVADDHAPQKHDFVPTSDAGWAAVDMRVAKRSMAHGNVVAVKSLLAHSKAVGRIETHGGEEGAALLAEARSWLKDAMAYEDAHGVDSRLDHNDPFIRDVIVPAKERLRKWRRRLASGTAAGAGDACFAEREG